MLILTGRLLSRSRPIHCYPKRSQVDRYPNEACIRTAPGMHQKSAKRTPEQRQACTSTAPGMLQNRDPSHIPGWLSAGSSCLCSVTGCPLLRIIGQLVVQLAWAQLVALSQLSVTFAPSPFSTCLSPARAVHHLRHVAVPLGQSAYVLSALLLRSFDSF